MAEEQESNSVEMEGNTNNDDTTTTTYKVQYVYPACFPWCATVILDDGWVVHQTQVRL
ncbi:MAG: hypothetical protein GY804_09585 [Alphaproteobacteria bacterium]|nr:hypothetical protein [Alphaproteobacteria bacterium]